jgi:DNA-binding NarL/FixJ family response regulator
VIVDDSHEFLTSARAMLESEGVTVLGVASTSREALRQVAALRPELVLVDIDLGAESGLDLVERLARSPAAECPRTVLISTHARADFAELIDASPAVGFVSKAELSAGTIRAALREAAGPGTA